MKLSELPTGSSAEIVSIAEPLLARQLNELGLNCGMMVSLTARAPFGCPVLIKSNSLKISLRLTDAAQVILK